MPTPKLSAFLTTKPLYYKKIDHERIHHAYARLKPHIRRPQTIHIVGTNGKGSTGRIIAYLALHGGKGNEKREVRSEKWVGTNTRNIYPLPATHYPLSVGHYTSPHILKFNERIWLNGADASDAVLEGAHERLFGILGEEMSEGLSYFEYTTLLAFVVFEKCDLMVLEAGLGGEYDATNVCPKELSVFTPIGIDHQAFLGEGIREIAATKLRSMQPGGQALIAPQLYPETIEVAQHIAEKKNATLYLADSVGCCTTGTSFGRPPTTPIEYDHKPTNTKGAVRAQHPTIYKQVEQIAKEKEWPAYLVDNAMVACQALDILGIAYTIDALKTLELFGRFYPLRPNLRIDVGHNPLAARALVRAMEPETVLIYNSLDDKDYEAVLQTLKPKLKRIEIIPIDTQRAATRDAIEAAVKATGLPYRYFDGTIHDDEHYLVFGSFYVVEELLRKLGMKNEIQQYA